VGVERQVVGRPQQGIAVQAHVHTVGGLASGREVGGRGGLVGVGAVDSPFAATLHINAAILATAGTRLWRYKCTFWRSSPQARNAAVRRRERSRSAAGSGRPLSACRSATNTYTSRAVSPARSASGWIAP